MAPKVTSAQEISKAVTDDAKGHQYTKGICLQRRNEGVAMTGTHIMSPLMRHENIYKS
jgi:hypothetical protein